MASYFCSQPLLKQKHYKILVAFRYKLPVWMMQSWQGMSKVACAICPEIL